MAFLRHLLLSMVLLLIHLELNNSQTPFEAAFRDCHKASPGFDNCIKNALNAIRPYFKTGIPEWNISPFDPFFAAEVVQNIGTPSLNYNLKLINVTEAGWTQSKVIKFRSDFENNRIRYTQYFPAKFLKGMYEFCSNILGRRLGLAGYWNLDLFGFLQTTTITRKPRKLEDDSYVYDTPLKVEIEVHSTKGLALHISNLLGGQKQLENLLDKIINFAWPPGFVISKPLVNDLVGTAFTGIFNTAFQNFSFDELIH